MGRRRKWEEKWDKEVLSSGWFTSPFFYFRGIGSTYLLSRSKPWEVSWPGATHNPFF
jgi:hypothetical protein